ncbi:MAG: hypothetical protein AB7G12_02360 [Thermoanaerobaculia bacterium]
MARIRTIPPHQASGQLKEAYDRLAPLFPPEYSHGDEDPDSAPELNPDGVVAAHSLLPEVMEPVFQAFVRLMAPELPLSRRQHEMINTVVSSVNRCQY